MKDNILRYFLVGLAVLSVGFASFSNALTLNNSEFPGQFEYQQVSNFYGSRNIKQYYNYTQDGISCIFISNSNRCTLNDGTTTYNLNEWVAYCTDSNTIILNCSNTVEIYYYLFLGNTFLKQWYPDMTSLQCQTNYSLIPVSSVDQNYCTSNNLCPVCEECDECPDTPIYTGDLTPGVSNIFINDVFHPGAFNVIMNIPEEIDWDYSYTSNGTNFNLDVVGYNQDTEYIEGLIDVQNYKPTSEDFSRVFLNFGNFGTLLIACLFVILVFYFVKKMFK